jgi:hypothetical protein
LIERFDPLPSKGNRANVTLFASGLNSSAVSQEIFCFENRMTVKNSLDGSTPPNPRTDSIPKGMTNSS